MLAGVCTGLAKYFNIDPVVVRLLVILLSFLGGAGIVGYIAAWILVPSDEAGQSG
jgi:phage shock protein PspC (stress-responsive transcriptional regulator)